MRNKPVNHIKSLPPVPRTKTKKLLVRGAGGSFADRKSKCIISLRWGRINVYGLSFFRCYLEEKL